ncbi:MAG: sulfite exporter TauE/SafE family protein [Acidimicrobiales bacterium]
MHVELYVVLASAAVGLLVGLTGVGGGALMTPMLVVLFGVTPSVAITSDLIAALCMRPLGAAIHWRQHQVSTSLVRYLCYGSVPAALLGTYVMHLSGQSHQGEHHLEVTLGVALVLGALAMLFRASQRSEQRSNAPVAPRRGATITIGAVGGFMVGLTSVGAGSLVLILLVWVYPRLSSGQLVGTDLAQSVPLTLSATIGSLLFAPVNVALTLSLVIGATPAVVVGSLLSSRSNTLALRRIISAVVLMSGLTYVGLSQRMLFACAVVVALGLFFVLRRDRRHDRAKVGGKLVAESVEHVVSLLPPALDTNS